MASDIKFLEFVKGQIKNAGVITYRMMFGEYVMYADGKLFALVCDNKLFIKPTVAGRSFIKDPTEAPPYPGAKNCFLLGEQLEDHKWLSQLVRITVKELPEPKPKKKKVKRKTRDLNLIYLKIGYPLVHSRSEGLLKTVIV